MVAGGTNWPTSSDPTYVNWTRQTAYDYSLAKLNAMNTSYNPSYPTATRTVPDPGYLILTYNTPYIAVNLDGRYGGNKQINGEAQIYNSWPSGGTLLSNGPSMQYGYTTMFYDGGSAGASTTAFDQTWNGGGAGQSASITTINNISVTPGQSYTITNNGSLTIQYYS